MIVQFWKSIILNKPKHFPRWDVVTCATSGICSRQRPKWAKYNKVKKLSQEDVDEIEGTMEEEEEEEEMSRISYYPVNPMMYQIMLNY